MQNCLEVKSCFCCTQVTVHSAMKQSSQVGWKIIQATTQSSPAYTEWLTNCKRLSWDMVRHESKIEKCEHCMNSWKLYCKPLACLTWESIPKNLAANRFFSEKIANNHLKETIQKLAYRKLQEFWVILSTCPLVRNQRITLKVSIYLLSLNYVI